MSHVFVAGLNGFTTAGDGVQVIGNSVDDTKPDGSLPALTGYVQRRVQNFIGGVQTR